MKFYLDKFINNCKSAVVGDKPQRAISEIVQDAVIELAIGAVLLSVAEMHNNLINALGTVRVMEIDSCEL